MITEVAASEIRVNDYVPIFGESGFHRVAVGPHRDPFSECYYYVNVLTSAGRRVSFKDLDRVQVLRFN